MIEGAGPPEARQVKLVDHTARSWTSSILVSGGQAPRHTTGAHRPITAESAAAGQATSDGADARLSSSVGDGDFERPPLPDRHGRVRRNVT